MTDKDGEPSMQQQRTLTWSVGNALYVVGLLVAILTGLFSAYWNVLQTINTQATTLASYEARLAIVEKQQAAQQQRDDNFAAEMRSALAKIQDGVTAVQVQEAARTGKAK